MTEELAKEKGIKIDKDGFQKEFQKHQELSRKGAEKRFKGGLGDHSVETTKLHTATHLLNQALREVLKKQDIFQRGSNITPERLRFDFNFDRKVTKEEQKKVEDWVNERIKDQLEVKREEMTLEEAKKAGAQGVFENKYGDKVFVYSIGKKSIEICGGPHIENTKELGHFKIKKEESSASGVRRIKAILE
jgi:alanyl-tRNA synthetase